MKEHLVSIIIKQNVTKFPPCSSRIEATDNDTTSEFNTVRYWIESSVTDFMVDGRSGHLLSLERQNATSKPSFTFKVSVNDKTKYFITF